MKKSYLLLAFVLSMSHSFANAYQLEWKNSNEAHLKCDSGFFVGSIRRSGDGYTNTDGMWTRDLQEIINSMMTRIRRDNSYCS